MNFFLRFAYLPALLLTGGLLALFCRLKYTRKQGMRLQYALTDTIFEQGHSSKHPRNKILNGIRLASLVILTFLMGKPQLVDVRSLAHVDGIDIILALDISGSMRFCDYDDDSRSRIEIAKEEAQRFVDKRINDSLGLVVFANDAVSRCPLTPDKSIVKQMIADLDIGLLDPDGTLLSTGLITAINRLKGSKAKSRIVILLTDGEPSEGDESADLAISIAKEMDIKVYTVGIGSQESQYVMHPWYGALVKPGINRQLLTKIAHETGGTFFNARHAHDMRSIYDTIDRLETTRYETTIYNTYYDIFIPFVWLVILLCFIELLLTTFIWFGL
jgi:Ca-activated chloride channel homolog